MKMNQTKRTFETDVQAQEVREFTIKQSAETFRILSDNIYSDKPGTVIRELSCNAWDAHIMGNTEDRPFDVHLPNSFEPYFSIRDYGTGLSEADIYNLYCTYGGTDKDNSNEVTGGFGLGSKSPFAYTDQFTVTSYFGGKKMTFNAFIGESGIPQIMKTNEEDTTEHVGLEVYMPVEQEDFRVFEDRAKKVYSRFPVQPMVEGLEAFQPETVEYIRQTKNYNLRKNRPYRYGSRENSCMVLQGLVAYPLDSRSMKSNITPLQHSIISGTFDLKFDLGEVGVTVSREHLNYDKRTEENILAKIDKVLKDLPNELQADIDKCKTLWEAKVLYNTWFARTTLDYTLKVHIGENLKYKKKPLESGIIRFALYDEAEEDVVPVAHFMYYSKATFDLKRVACQRYVAPDIKAQEDVVFVYNDTNDKISTVKVKYHFKEKDQDIYIVTCEKKRLKEVREKLGNPPMKNWSSYAEPPKIFKEKIKTQTLIKKLLKFNSNSYKTWSDTDHDVAKGGLYVITFSRDPQLTYTGGPSVRSLSRLLETAQELNFVDEDVNVFGIQSSFKNIPTQYEGWVQVEEHIKTKLEQHLKTINLPKLVANYKAIDNAEYSLKYISSKDLNIIKTNSLMKKFSVQITKMKESIRGHNTKALINLCDKYDITIRELKPDYDLKKLEDLCTTKYPALSVVLNCRHKLIEHYINVCDASPSIKY